MTSVAKSFEDLQVRQLAIDLVPDVYSLTKNMPRHEIFCLTGQIRRAAVSVPANIAEGQARHHTKEFLHHLSVARGSLAELHALILVAERPSYVSQEEVQRSLDKISHVRMLLSGLIKKLRDRA